MKKNLFQAVKTYINGVEVGKTFTTKHLIDVVGDHEVPTWWKSVNNNPYYRTHTYKSYLRRTGFLSNPKRGVWKVEKHIPEFVTLGTIEFLIGYKKIYNGLTRLETEDKINNLQYKSPLLEDFPTKPGFVEKRLALQEKHEKQMGEIFDGETTQQFLASIGMEGQMLRQLIMSQPIDEIKYLIEEREDLENIRILSEISKEKDMKVHYDFNEGILRVKKYLKDGAEKCKYELFQNIKQCDDINELEEVLQRYKLTERIVEQAIENLEQAGYIVEVFESVEDTILGGEETLIISLMLNIKIEEL
jgi:hypothetical protein